MLLFRNVFIYFSYYELFEFRIRPIFNHPVALHILEYFINTQFVKLPLLKKKQKFFVLCFTILLVVVFVVFHVVEYTIYIYMIIIKYNIL